MQQRSSDLHCVNALEEGPLSPGEIGARLALSSGAVTALINRLVKAGFAHKTADRADGRRFEVRLTSKFRSRAARIYSRLGAAVESEFALATPTEKKLACSVITRLADGFSAASQTE